MIFKYIFFKCSLKFFYLRPQTISNQIGRSRGCHAIPALCFKFAPTSLQHFFPNRLLHKTIFFSLNIIIIAFDVSLFGHILYIRILRLSLQINFLLKKKEKKEKREVIFVNFLFLFLYTFQGKGLGSNPIFYILYSAVNYVHNIVWKDLFVYH